MIRGSLRWLASVAVCTLLLLPGSSSRLLAQKAPADALGVEIELGRHYAQDRPLQATRFTFEYPVVHHGFDTSTQLLTFITRALSKDGATLKKKGAIVQYDLRAGRVAWRKEINFNYEGYLQTGPTLLYQRKGVVSTLDPRTGRPAKVLKHSLFFLSAGGGVGIGHDAVDAKGVAKFHGLDIATRAMRWERELDVTFGCDEFVTYGDTAAVVIASGLHTIDLRDGGGWSVPAITGHLDHTSASRQTAVGTLGLSGIGSDYMSAGPDRVYRLVSNFLTEADGYVLASADQIQRIGFDGEVRWSTPLPVPEGSQSVLSQVGDRYALISTGAAIRNRWVTSHGKVYLAGFDSVTGARQYFTVLFTEGSAPVDALLVDSARALLKIGPKLYLADLSTGKILAEKIIEANNGGLSGLPDQRAFFRESNRVRSVLGDEAGYHYAVDKDYNLIRLDSSLGYVATIPKEDLFKAVAKTSGGGTIVSNGKLIVALDSDGVPRADVPGDLGTNQTGDLLFIRDGNVTTIVDTREMMN